MQVQGFLAHSSSATPCAECRIASCRRRKVPGSLLQASKGRAPRIFCQRVAIHHSPWTSTSLVARASEERQSGSSAQDSEGQPSAANLVPSAQPGQPSSRIGAESSSSQTTPSLQQYPFVSEGRRSESWSYKQGADKRSIWGTFIKGIALLVLGVGAGLSKLKGFLGRAGQVLGELTYPKPGAILRLTCAVLVSSAVLTLIVWGLDKGFSTALLPPVLHRLSEIS